MLGRFRWLLISLWLVSLTACGAPAAPTATSVPVAATSEPPSTLTSVPTTLAAAVTPTSVSTAVTSRAAAGGATVPSSCKALESLIGTYMGGVATTKSLGVPQHLSCEFANTDASIIIVVNIGVGGTAAAFDALRSSSAKGGRTVTEISGLGASAFSVSKNNVPAGVSVLTDQGLVYDVNSNLPIAQDQSLIEQLMKLP
jgi:hypothetical protein